MGDERTLLVVRPDGTTDWLFNQYESIKAALDGATIDFVPFSKELGCFLNDNGIAERLPMNVPVSLIAGRLLWGPCVLVSGQTDDEGETLPPPERARKAALGLCVLWRAVVADAQRNNQDIRVYADPDSQTPPTVVELTHQEFEQWMSTGVPPKEWGL
jgi:hypothetical protein